jgi:phenylalanyl-tRNA synthetase beta chain
VVDITNYVLLELGQPMHAFDLERLSGGVEVRFARRGEQLTLLDERCIDLDSDTLLICDQERPRALAGIMGGIDSGISAATRSLFLEVAFFAPDLIAGKARSYGLTTDASYRYERGVDPQLTRRAMERATALLLAIVGGEAGPMVEAVAPEQLPAEREILLRRSRIQRLLGFLPEDAQVTDILTRLGLRLAPHAQGWTVVAPSFRFDLGMEADLIEEVGRVFGYENLPSTSNRGDLTLRPLPEAHTPLARLRAALVDRGYQEAITYSFVAADLLEAVEPGVASVALQNPISADLSVMRSSLWAGLAAALKHNLARQQNRVRLFESGLKFISQDTEIKQTNFIAGIVAGDLFPEQWGVARQPADFFDAKADVEALLAGCSVSGVFEPGTHPALHPGQSARVSVAGQAVGWVGCVHPAVAQKLEIPKQSHVFELNLDILHQGKVPSFQNLSRFPSIRRDLAIVVSVETPAGALCHAITRRAGPMLRELRVFDVYQGKGIETGRKSIAFGLILQDSSRTLTDADVDAVMTGVTAQLEEQFGATLRE